MQLGPPGLRLVQRPHQRHPPSRIIAHRGDEVSGVLSGGRHTSFSGGHAHREQPAEPSHQADPRESKATPRTLAAPAAAGGHRRSRGDGAGAGRRGGARPERREPKPPRPSSTGPSRSQDPDDPATAPYELDEPLYIDGRQLPRPWWSSSAALAGSRTAQHQTSRGWGPRPTKSARAATVISPNGREDAETMFGRRTRAHLRF